MQLTKGDKLAVLDLPDLNKIKNNFREIGELMVGLMNNQGGNIMYIRVLNNKLVSVWMDSLE